MSSIKVNNRRHFLFFGLKYDPPISLDIVGFSLSASCKNQGRDAHSCVVMDGPQVTALYCLSFIKHGPICYPGEGGGVPV